MTSMILRRTKSKKKEKNNKNQSRKRVLVLLFLCKDIGSTHLNALAFPTRQEINNDLKEFHLVLKNAES